MASKKIAQSGQATPPGDDQDTQQPIPGNPGDHPGNQTQVRPGNGANSENPGSGGEDIDVPPIFTTDIQLDGTKRATGLAATALSRFNPAETRPQLAEHYTFRDEDYFKRGYI